MHHEHSTIFPFFSETPKERVFQRDSLSLMLK
jgi:hypothetical protein